MLILDNTSEVLDDIIMSRLDVSACRTLLDFLFPYSYHLVNSGCYNMRQEIIVNGNGNYHITAYDIPYIDACEKVVKFESNNQSAYPVMFVSLDCPESRVDYFACSLIKIFSCVYDRLPLIVFIFDGRVAFGTVCSESEIEDNFCISDWFFPVDFDTKVSFVDDAYSLGDVISWIKHVSRIEKTKTRLKKTRKTTRKVQLWNYDCSEFNWDYINALMQFQYYTGVSTERQIHEYYMAFDEEIEENYHSIIDEENSTLGYTFDDIATEIAHVGNPAHFEELDEYSEYLERSEIKGMNLIANDYSDPLDLLDIDEDIPEYVLDDPEKLLKYLEGKKNSDKATCQRKLDGEVESEPITFYSLKDAEVIHLSEMMTTMHDVDGCGSVNNVTVDENPISEIRNSEPQVYSDTELETVIINIQKPQIAIDDVFDKEPTSVVSEPDSYYVAVQGTQTDVNSVPDEDLGDDVSNMITHFELISMVNVHSETVFRYIHEHKIIPDKVIQVGPRAKYFFSQDNLQKILEKYDWQLISESNKRYIFLKMINKMTMSFSYKPVFIKAFFANAKKGKASMSKIVSYFCEFYESRRKAGLFVEKPNSIFATSRYSKQEVKKLILVYPYKRFAEMQIFTYSNLLSTVSMDCVLWDSLQSSEIAEICRLCDEHIETYYSRFN